MLTRRFKGSRVHFEYCGGKEETKGLDKSGAVKAIKGILDPVLLRLNLKEMSNRSQKYLATKNKISANPAV